MMTSSSNFYQVGASLPVDAKCYVQRQADEEFYQKLSSGKFCYVLNSRQMGKSSLRVRTMQRLQENGTVCAAIDLTGIGKHKVTISQWYAGIAYGLVESCQLEDKFDFDWQTWWYKKQSTLDPVMCLRLFIKEVLLEKIQQPIVIFVDEIDRVLSQDFSLNDFFALIRFFQNQRVDNPIFERLTFALLGVATPSDLITDKTQTPFNIGSGIELHGFRLKEVQPLIKGLESKVPNPYQVMEEILDWTGGQPFLTQKLCQFMVEESLSDNVRTVEQVVRSRIIDNWETQDEPEHLRTIQNQLLSNEKRAARLLGLHQKILQQREVLANGNSEQMALQLSGLIVKHQNCLKIYNHIYKAVFDQSWVEQRLAQKRPYSEQLKAWFNSECQDKSRLLRGNALQDALAWADSKSLTDEDYKFLNDSQEEQNKLRKHRQKVTWLWAAIMTITVTGMGGWQFWLNKIPYILYPDRFSQGERTFFLSEENSGVFNGMKAFKQKKFIEAEAFFKRANDANSNDPEIMIYKNNSKAWAKGNPFTLGVSLPLDNKKRTSRSILQGVALAQQEFNSNLQANRLLNIILAKDEDDLKQVKEVAQEFIKDENVLGVIGHNTSSSTKSVLDKYQKAHLGIISPSSSSTELSSNGFFRTVASDRVTGKSLADYAIKDKIKRVAIFYEESSYGRSLKNEFQKEFEKRGGKIVIKPIDLMKLNSNYSFIVKQIVLKDQADAAIFCTNTALYDIVLQIILARNNIPNFSKKLKLIAGDGLYADRSLKQPFEGLILAPSWFEKQENGQEKEFTKKFKKTWNEHPYWKTATSYDATKAFIKAISSSVNPNRETVFENLKSVKLSPNETSGEELNFSEGERTQKLTLVKVVKIKHCTQVEKLCYEYEMVKK